MVKSMGTVRPMNDTHTIVLYDLRGNKEGIPF